MFEGIDGSEVLLRFAIGDDAASVLGFFGDGDGEARSITSWCESRKLRNVGNLFPLDFHTNLFFRQNSGMNGHSLPERAMH